MTTVAGHVPAPAATVVDPEIANDDQFVNDPELANEMASATIACVPVVTVTTGPTVVRSVYDADTVVCPVVMNPAEGVRAASAFAAVDTTICPAWVTSAGAVWFRLSRMLPLN